MHLYVMYYDLNQFNDTCIYCDYFEFKTTDCDLFSNNYSSIHKIILNENQFDSNTIHNTHIYKYIFNTHTL